MTVQNWMDIIRIVVGLLTLVFTLLTIRNIKKADKSLVEIKKQLSIQDDYETKERVREQ